MHLDDTNYMYLVSWKESRQTKHMVTVHTYSQHQLNHQPSASNLIIHHASYIPMHTSVTTDVYIPDPQDMKPTEPCTVKLK
jgi:hypothetical protein